MVELKVINVLWLSSTLLLLASMAEVVDRVGQLVHYAVCSSCLIVLRVLKGSKPGLVSLFLGPSILFFINLFLVINLSHKQHAIHA